ncbi:3221_t:CDS:2, partial [Acaulospora morrowiae]
DPQTVLCTMSLTGVNNNSYNNSPFSPVTQQSTFRPYISSVNSVIEQDYEGRSSYSNDESTLEDNIGGVGYERGTDKSDSEVAEDDQNNSSIQNHPFENGNNFNNIHRNSGGITN